MGVWYTFCVSVIVPAILPTSRADLEDKLARILGVAEDVQIDVVDGRYADTTSWPYVAGQSNEFSGMVARGETLPWWGRFRFEIDLMVREPEAVAGMWIALGASRLVFHAGSSDELPETIAHLQKKFGHDKDFAPDLLSFGVAIGTTTPFETIAPLLPHVDFVQFMGINRIGRQGEAFNRHVLERIRSFSKEFRGVPIQVDGGVSLASAPDLLELGVSRLVVGSALWKSTDPKNTYEKFEQLSERYGIYE